MRIIASYGTSAFSAIVITSINYSDDTITSGYYYDGKISGLKRRLMHHSTKVDYINVYRHRYYLHDFMTTGSYSYNVCI